MFVRKKKNRSGSTSVIVVEKTSNKYKEHITIGISSDENEIEGLVEQGKEWIREYQSRHSPELDLYGEETEAKIKNESKSIRRWILEQEKVDRWMHEYDKGNGRRLLVGYTADRAKKDAYNREKGVRRLEKSYKRGKLTKESINKRGYNKFLDMKNEVEISINYEKIAEDAAWDGLKGYLTNTDLPADKIYEAYHNLWTVELAFRIAKSKIEVRPMFHFTKKRIEAHICICFVALKVYKELDRILKLNNINMSVDKVLRMAKTITTLQVRLPLSNEILSKVMIMKRH
ncbi:MAG: transposase, partial [Bacteroidales bacterium]|nr:transposase [Bacteroidales bacterium]